MLPAKIFGWSESQGYGIRALDDVITYHDLYDLQQPLQDLHQHLMATARESEDERSCSPTLPYGTLVGCELRFLHKTVQIVMDDSLPLEVVRQLWEGHLVPGEGVAQIEAGAFFTFKRPAWEFSDQFENFGILIKDGILFIQSLHDQVDCATFLKDENQDHTWHDQFGAIGVGQQCDQFVLFTQQPFLPEVSVISSRSFLQALPQVQTSWLWDAGTDSLVATFAGEIAHAVTLANFWKGIAAPSTLSIFGCEVVSGLQLGSPFIQFVMLRGRSLPPQIWKLTISVLATRSILDTMIDEAYGVPIVLRWCGRPLWSGPMDATTSAQELSNILRNTLALIGQ